MRQRIYGGVCIAAFLPLLLWFNSLAPVGPTEGVRYRLDAWQHPPVNEPFANGKSLSYWASRVDGLANESEPALAAIRSMGREGVNALTLGFQTGEGHWKVGEERPQPWQVRERAAAALAKLEAHSAPAVPLMIDSLRSSDRNTREQAAEVLGRAGDVSQPVINALIQTLGDEDTAYHAMNALTRLAEKSPAIIPQLAAITRGPKSKAAYWAMVTLSEIGPESVSVLPELIECVQRGPGESRQPAIQAIALIGPNATQAVPALEAALKDPDTWARKCTYIALGRIGPAASNAVPALRSALTNESYQPSQMDIARSLWRIDRGQLDLVLPAISKSLDDGDKELQQEHRLTYNHLSALDLLGEIGIDAVSFVPRLRQYLNADDSDVQFNAAWSLWRVSPADGPAAQATLRNLIGLENYPLETIGQDDWGRALSDLKRNRESFHPRIAALGALWQMDEKDRPMLAAALADLLRDWDYFSSMKGLSPEDAVAVPAITAIESDPAHVKVRENARVAIRAIMGKSGERW